MERTTSGRVTLRISLQPSCPSKSSSVSCAACSMVPMAPSATTTRSRSAASKDAESGIGSGYRSGGARHRRTAAEPRLVVGLGSSSGQATRTPYDDMVTALDDPPELRSPVVVADGAMGTMLQAAQLTLDD